MRRRLLFGKFDHIEIHRNGEIVTEMDINVGELIADLEVFGVYKSGRKVKVKNSDCVWESEGPCVVVGADNGQVTGVIGSDIPVVVKATYSKGSNAYEATVEFTVHLYTYKYFVNARQNFSLECTDTSAVFSYSLYKTTYDNGTFVNCEVSNDSLTTTLTIDGDYVMSTVVNGPKYTVNGLDNKHNVHMKTYVGTFLLNGTDYEEETVNFDGREHNNVITVTHLQDTESGRVTYSYGDLVLQVNKNNLVFSNTGGDDSITATTTQTEIETRYWASDNLVSREITNMLTDSAIFTWNGSITPFEIDTRSGKTVTISASVTSSSSDVERTLTLNAVSTKDSSKTAELSIRLLQESKTIVGYETISLKDATSTNPVVPAKGGSTSFSATYQQVARWSDGSTTIVEIPSANVAYTQHSFDSLGTTPTTGETVVANGITVLVTGLGTNPSTTTFKYDAKQAENKLVKTEYLTPTISYSGENPIIIPASGGSAAADTTKVTVSQKKKETYSSEATIEKDADVSGATKNASTVTASSLGTTTKPQTKVGDSTITVLVNGQTETLNISVEQAENISHDGNKGTTVTYSDWNIYFTNDTTTSNQDIYLDEKFGDDKYIEPDNANNTYNNTEETYSEIGKMGATKDVHIRAVRVKSTKYYYSSGEPCHIVKGPDYYGDTVKSGLTVSCNNGVSMGTVSSPNAQNVLTSTFPNPGSNHTLAKKSWTVTVNLGGKTVTKTISQEAGVITWDDKTPSVVYTEAAPTEGAQSTHTAIDASMKWHWNDDTDKTTVTATASYELVGTVPSGTTINATTGVITWPKNEDDSRNVTVKITLTANSDVAGDTAKVVSNEVTATQKSGLIVDHYTITGYRVYVNSETQNIGAAGGSFGISRGGSVTYTETYVSGTTSSAKTKDIPADKISVAESGDTYNTFGTASWNGANATVSVDSHKTAVRNAQTVVYTPSITEANLRSLFDETVNSIGTATVETLNISQAKNEKRGSVYGDVSLNPTSKDITFSATGGTIDTEVTASQTYYDYYSSYEDGDTVNGKTTLMNVTSFTFADPVESGSYLDDFAASHQLISNKHYVRVTANVNTSTSGKNGYSATMQVTGADNKKASVVINASQNAGTETYKFFIVAGADKNLAVTGTSADFTYKLYRTTYVSGVYMSCAEANGTVTGTYGDSISGTGSSTNGTMSKAVSSNAHNTSTKKYSVTFAIPSGTAQETTNFDGKTADYTQVIIHLADSIDETKTVITYTDYDVWIASPVTFSKAGESQDLTGYSTEKKTTYYYWSSDSTEIVASRKVETLKNESTWSWGQEESTVWTLTNKTSRTATETVTANDTDRIRNIEVSLTGTSTNNLSNTKTAKMILAQYAGLETKYFIVANADSRIGCSATTANYGYRVIENSYNGAGVYLYSTVYTGSGVDVEMTFGVQKYTITGVDRGKTVINLSKNLHSLNDVEYVATFKFVDSSLQDTEHLTVITLDGNTYQEDLRQVIIQAADEYSTDELVEYIDMRITLADIEFSREGETKSITASPSITKNTYDTWNSDNTKVSSSPKSSTVITTANDWEWSWYIGESEHSSVITPIFTIDSGYTTTNPTRVTVGENTSDAERTDRLNVKATFKNDRTITKTVYCTLRQEAGNVLEWVELIINASGSISYNGTADYQVIAHYSASGDVDVTEDAGVWFYTTQYGTTESDKITVNYDNYTVNGKNQGDSLTYPNYLAIYPFDDNVWNGITTLDRPSFEVREYMYTVGNNASNDVTVYGEATFDGIDSSRVSLVVRGQSKNNPVAYYDYPNDIEWSVAEEGATVEPTEGNETTFYPWQRGKFTLIAEKTDGSGLSDYVTIDVERYVNYITIRTLSMSEFIIEATEPVGSLNDIDFEWEDSDGLHSGNVSFSDLGATSVTYNTGVSSFKVLTSISGIENDDLYDYEYGFINEEYTDLVIEIDDNSISYNGSTTYAVKLQDSNGTWIDVTSYCPIVGYADSSYSTISGAVVNANNNSSGGITGCNYGEYLEPYDTYYVDPNSDNHVTGQEYEIWAYTQHYGEGMTASTPKEVYFYATFVGLSAYNSLTVEGASEIPQEEGNEYTVVSNWSVDSSNAEVRPIQGASTSFYTDEPGVYTVTGQPRSGNYVTPQGYSRDCTLTVVSGTKYLAADDIVMNWSDSGTVYITATHNGLEVTGLTFSGYNSSLCSIASNGCITVKNSGSTSVTISKSGYESVTILLTINDDRVTYTMDFHSPSGYSLGQGGFNANLVCISNILGVSSATLSEDYGAITVYGFYGDTVYYSFTLIDDTTVTSGGEIYDVSCSYTPTSDQLTMPWGGDYVDVYTTATISRVDRLYTININWNDEAYDNWTPCTGGDGGNAARVRFTITYPDTGNSYYTDLYYPDNMIEFNLPAGSTIDIGTIGDYHRGIEYYGTLEHTQFMVDFGYPTRIVTTNYDATAIEISVSAHY